MKLHFVGHGSAEIVSYFLEIIMKNEEGKWLSGICCYVLFIVTNSKRNSVKITMVSNYNLVIIRRKYNLLFWYFLCIMKKKDPNLSISHYFRQNIFLICMKGSIHQKIISVIIEKCMISWVLFLLCYVIYFTMKM